MRNEQSLDGLCAALAYAMGIAPPEHAAQPVQALCDYVDKAFDGRKADRIFMYNPDAIGQWIAEKYPHLMKRVLENTDLQIPYTTVDPSVTPVCFATMYTGAQPEVHGLTEYRKKTLEIDTLFDALIRAGKKPVILAITGGSMDVLFRDRDMDYYCFKTIEEINAKAVELILADEHDFIVVYNSNYDQKLHHFGPERTETLAELRVNDSIFGMFSHLIRSRWKHHDTLMAFAMDHGCHHTPMGEGLHGENIDPDMNILHHYRIYPRE